MRADPKKTYRLSSKEMYTTAELMACIFHNYEDSKPDSDRCPRAKYYCHNEDCEVRTVEVFRKSHSGSPCRSTPMKCPSCGERLEMLCFVRTETLEPCEADT